MPDEMFAELEEEVKEAQTAHDQGEKEVEDKEVVEDEKPVEEAVEEKEEKKETPRVPLPELLDERKKRQAVEAELAEQREKFARVDERLNLLSETVKEKPPSYEDDPFEALRYNSEQTGQSVNQLREQVEGLSKGNEGRQEAAQLEQYVVSAENAFRGQNENYDDAVKFLRSGRDAEFQAMGVSDPAQREHMLTQEAYQLANMAVKQNGNPAEIAYNLAVARGFKTKETVPNDKLDNVQKGQDKSSSLSSVGGGEEKTLDVEALANMDDADFADAMKSGQFEKLLRQS